MTDDRSHSSARQRHDNLGQHRRKLGSGTKQRRIESAQKGREGSTGHDRYQLFGRYPVIIRANNPIHESHDKLNRVWVGHHCLKLGERCSVSVSFQLFGPRQPTTDKRNGFVGQAVISGKGVSRRMIRREVHSPILTGGARLVLYDSTSMSDDSHNQDRYGPFLCQRELIALFETLVNVIFVIKDLSGRYLEVNSAFVRRTGKRSKRDVIGTTARDHFVDELAERYEEQDRRVVETRTPLRNQLELIKRSNGELGWYLTTKLPVADEADPTCLVGVVSVSRDLHAPSPVDLAMASLQQVVDYTRDHLSQTIRVSDLAVVAGCSPSQLKRRMTKVLGVTPTQHILRVRVEAAARMLTESDKPIAAIATSCGFYDQPDFTRRFARLTNSTPAQFRAQGGTFGVSS